MDDGIYFYEGPNFNNSISISIETLNVMYSNNKLQPLKVYLEATNGKLSIRDSELFVLKIE